MFAMPSPNPRLAGEGAKRPISFLFDRSWVPFLFSQEPNRSSLKTSKLLQKSHSTPGLRKHWKFIGGRDSESLMTFTPGGTSGSFVRHSNMDIPDASSYTSFDVAITDKCSSMLKEIAIRSVAIKIEIMDIQWRSFRLLQDHIDVIYDESMRILGLLTKVPDTNLKSLQMIQDTLRTKKLSYKAMTQHSISLTESFLFLSKIRCEYLTAFYQPLMVMFDMAEAWMDRILSGQIKVGLPFLEQLERALAAKPIHVREYNTCRLQFSKNILELQSLLRATDMDLQHITLLQDGFMPVSSLSPDNLKTGCDSALKPAGKVIISFLYYALNTN